MRQHVSDREFHAWLDGETSASESERIERHMSDCDACVGVLEQAAQVHARAGELIRNASPSSPPEWAELVERAAATPDQGTERASSRPERTVRRLSPGLAWAATVIAAFSLGWWAGLGPNGTVVPGQGSAGPPEQTAVAPIGGETEAGVDDAAPAAAREPADATAEDAVAAPPAPPTANPTVPEQPRRPDSAEPSAQNRAAAPAQRTQLVAEEQRAASQSALADADTALAASPSARASEPRGRTILRLPGATLIASSLAPATGPGATGAAEVVLIFDDPRTGARVTLTHRPAMGDAPTGLDTPTFRVLPGGDSSLVWVTGEGMRVELRAGVDEPTLRELARRLE